MGNVPRHVAIIMDGNGRWAQERGLPRIRGHQKGVESIREILKAAIALRIQYLTLYAFSKENWARPKPEVEFLMNLLGEYLDSELDQMNVQGIRLQVIGKMEDLPEFIRKKIERNIERTRGNTALTLNLALSYSSRLEILEALRRLCGEVASGRLAPEAIDEACFSNRLYTAGIPDPDLLIRTSGEMRVSNFLLWQISYTEIYVSDKYWPDFHREDFEKAIEEFGKRERRFGKTENARTGS